MLSRDVSQDWRTTRLLLCELKENQHGKPFKKIGVMPKKETLQKYNITQEEIDEYIPKK